MPHVSTAPLPLSAPTSIAVLRIERSQRHMTISRLPDEVLELVASQLVLNFQDVISFSTTSRRIHTATKFLISPPLCIKDVSGTDELDQELTNPALGLVRSAIIDVKFTLAKSQSQNEQLRQLLSRAPRLRYLSIRRPAPDPLEFTPRYEPSRSKTTAHPFPLRSSHFQPSSSYLRSLTHLELHGLSIHPLIFSRLPCLTHVKLSLSSQHDAYLPTDALNIVSSAKYCKISGFEISLHAGPAARERLDVVKACVAAWPGIEILNLISAENGRIPSLFHRWQNSEDLIPSVTDLATAIKPAQKLKHLALGIIPLDVDKIPTSSVTISTHVESQLIPGSLSALGAIFRAVCPSLESFRCLVPLGTRPGKRPFTEFYEVARANWQLEGWEYTRENSAGVIPRIFGMLG